MKGCLDGENTNKFERPTEADEFITWSLCTNSGADPRRNHPQQRGPRERELEIASGRRNSGRCWILIQHLPANTIAAVTGACRARAKSRRCCGADRICDVARRKPDRRQVRVTRITPINSKPPPRRRSGLIGCADVIRNPKWSSGRVVAICPNTTTATVEAAPSRPTLTTTPSDKRRQEGRHTRSTAELRPRFRRRARAHATRSESGRASRLRSAATPD